MALVDVTLAEGVERAELLRLVGAIEHASEHPIGRAIAAAARASSAQLPAADLFVSREGPRRRGRRRRAHAARRTAVAPARRGDRAAGPAHGRVEHAQAVGRSAIAAAWDGEARGVLEIADSVKPASAEAISLLRALGLRPLLLTGDSSQTAEPSRSSWASTRSSPTSCRPRRLP